MKTFYLLLLFISISLPAFSQYPDEITNRSSEEPDHSSEELGDLLSLDILSPGLSYELKVNDMNTLVIGGHVKTNVSFTASTFGTEFYYLMVPQVNFEYRHYYNLEKRYKLQKRTWFNSANYYGVVTGYQTDPIAGDESASDYEPGFYIGPVWGIQRNGAFTFNLNLGLGYFSGTGGVGFLGDIRLGINLSKAFAGTE